MRKSDSGGSDIYQFISECRNDMQVTSYGKLLEKVEKLNQAEQLRLLEQIAVLIRSRATAKTRRSILELQGMGKNISFYPLLYCS
jgi:predicted transposase YdaD